MTRSSPTHQLSTASDPCAALYLRTTELRAVVVRLWTASSFSFSLLRLPQDLATGDEDSEQETKICDLVTSVRKYINFLLYLFSLPLSALLFTLPIYFWSYSNPFRTKGKDQKLSTHLSGKAGGCRKKREMRCCVAVESISLSLRLWVDITAVLYALLFLGAGLSSLLRYVKLFTQCEPFFWVSRGGTPIYRLFMKWIFRR